MTIDELGPELTATDDLAVEDGEQIDLDLHVYDVDEIQTDGSQIEEQPLAESMEGHDPEDYEGTEE